MTTNQVDMRLDFKVLTGQRRDNMLSECRGNGMRCDRTNKPIDTHTDGCGASERVSGFLLPSPTCGRWEDHLGAHTYELAAPPGSSRGFHPIPPRRSPDPARAPAATRAREGAPGERRLHGHSSAQSMSNPCWPVATAPVDSSPRLAVLGVISSPANEARRNWARQFQEGRPDLLLRFVIGAFDLPVQQCQRLLREERVHGGMFLVPASDNAEVGCVDKSFAWLMAAVEAFPATQFIIKTDDDSATNMADLAALLSMRELQSHPHVYAGWAQFASALPATWQQCGWGASPASALRKRQGCASGAEGPFVFATGALEILSSELARKVFGSG